MPHRLIASLLRIYPTKFARAIVSLIPTMRSMRSSLQLAVPRLELEHLYQKRCWKPSNDRSLNIDLVCPMFWVKQEVHCSLPTCRSGCPGTWGTRRLATGAGCQRLDILGWIRFGPLFALFVGIQAQACAWELEIFQWTGKAKFPIRWIPRVYLSLSKPDNKHVVWFWMVWICFDHSEHLWTCFLQNLKRRKLATKRRKLATKRRKSKWSFLEVVCNARDRFFRPWLIQSVCQFTTHGLRAWSRRHSEQREMPHAKYVWGIGHCARNALYMCVCQLFWPGLTF